MWESQERRQDREKDDCEEKNYNEQINIGMIKSVK